MAKKKKTSSKKTSSPKKKKVVLQEVAVEEESAESIFLAHARKLGIPEDGTIFDTDELKAQWTGSGTKCSEVLSAVEKKVLANEFVRVEIPIVEEFLDDPVVEALQKLELIPEKRRESIFRKSKGGWIATVMSEHNLADTSEEDTAAVFFYIEEE